MRIRKLNIHNFRGFRRFTMKDLGWVNLIVGTNNCGKTTILEAIHILMAVGDLSAIWSSLSRRGEDIWVERDLPGPGSSREVEIRRLFFGHEIELNTQFKLSAETDLGGRLISAKIDENSQAQQQPIDVEPYSDELSEDLLPPLSLSLAWSNGPARELTVPITRRGGITSQAVRRSSPMVPAETNPRIRFVTASSLSGEVVTSLFEDVVLRPEEELVTDAMRIIEPSIERIASGGSERNRSAVRATTRGGILVRLKDIKDRIPIGSMGDGIWRLLGLALALVRTENGILLVDEIDTGLHHTIMAEMWRLIHRSAKQYNVQVFATTHSRDCFESLAVISRDQVYENSEVTIQRIERGREEAVAYAEQEIVAAAERGMEVR